MVLKPQKVVLPEAVEEINVKPEYPEKEIALNHEIEAIKPGESVKMAPEPELHKNDLPKKEEKPQITEHSPETPENSEQSKLPVIYTGKELIRNKFTPKNSKEEVLVTIIRGKAVVTQGQMQMRSHEIKIIGKENDKAISDYPVKINDFKSNTEITAGYGQFTKKDSKAYFRKNPVLTHVDSGTGEKTTIHGDQMFHFFETGISVVYGHVVINDAQGVAYAKKAIYYKKDDRIELEGNPRIYEKNNIYQSDRMTLYRKTKKALMAGNSRVISLEQDETGDNRERTNGTVDTLILSDNAEYNYGTLPKSVNFTTIHASGFVYVSRKDSDTYCRRAVARGESPDEIDLFNDIYVLDKENRTRLYGQYSEYRKKDSRLWVYTRKNLEGNLVNPEVYFYNKEDELTGKMKGEIFERLLDDKITYARGDIDFKLYEKKTSPQNPDSVKNEIIGQWAESEDSKREVYIYGKPYIKQEDRNIYAGKIIVYPDENRVDLQHSIEGNF